MHQMLHCETMLWCIGEVLKIQPKGYCCDVDYCVSGQGVVLVQSVFSDEVFSEALIRMGWQNRACKEMGCELTHLQARIVTMYDMVLLMINVSDHACNYDYRDYSLMIDFGNVTEYVFLLF